MPLTNRVGRARAQLEDPQLNAVGRTPLDRPAATTRTVENFFDHQWAEKRNRMSYATLFLGRGDDGDVSQGLQLVFERRQARRVNSVVVRQKNLHGC